MTEGKGKLDTHDGGDQQNQVLMSGNDRKQTKQTSATTIIVTVGLMPRPDLSATNTAPQTQALCGGFGHIGASWVHEPEAHSAPIWQQAPGGKPDAA